MYLFGNAKPSKYARFFTCPLGKFLMKCLGARVDESRKKHENKIENVFGC